MRLSDYFKKAVKGVKEATIPNTSEWPYGKQPEPILIPVIADRPKKEKIYKGYKL